MKTEWSEIMQYCRKLTETYYGKNVFVKFFSDCSL